MKKEGDLFPDADFPVLSTWDVSIAGHHGLWLQEVFALDGVKNSFLARYGANAEHRPLPHPLRSTGGSALLPPSHPPPDKKGQKEKKEFKLFSFFSSFSKKKN